MELTTFPSLEEAKTYQGFEKIPISLRIPATKSTSALCHILKKVSKNVFVLESCEDSKWGRYSFFGYDPVLELVCKDHHLKVSAGTTFTSQDSPHKMIRQILEENKSPKIPGLPPLTGGLVGFFSYEFIKYSEECLDVDSEDQEGFQDVDLMLFDKIIAVDRQENQVVLLCNIDGKNLDTSYHKGVETLKAMKALVEQGLEQENQPGKLLSPLTPAFEEGAFCQMVDKAKDYIYQGDIFQVVLSNPLTAQYQGGIYHVYENLRRNNPSPYLFYFSSEEVELAGASPETLVKLREGKVTTFPLAGTRPRGQNPEEDLALEKELLADEKERAEHNMLVDLGRNDIGKISKLGTVEVEEYMKIHRFSHVMHIGSTVSGTIREELDGLDAIDAVLPAGTLSGAPKIRACQIIQELEGQKRGIYGGAVGYLDFSGNMDTCIAIRLVFQKNGKIFVRSGAGIVADSVGKSEYQECLHKAKAVVHALEVE